MGRVSDEQIWNFFLDLFSGNEFAAAGACGNMQEESSFYSNNAENEFANRHDWTDQQITDFINSGSWDLDYFLHDNASPPRYTDWWVNKYGWGYGLSQWTTDTRRTELWNRTRAQGLGIDDAGAQLQYIHDEFTGVAHRQNPAITDYSGVRNAMVQARSVDEAVKIYCNSYEGGTPKQSRYTYAHDFYNRFAGGGTGYAIRLHAQGNCNPFATLHLNEGMDKQIFYADAGTDVFIHANVGAGDYFEIWTSDSGGANIDVVTNETTFFTMRPNAVDITAHATGITPEPPPYPPVPPTPILHPRKYKRMPIWMYPMLRT